MHSRASNWAVQSETNRNSVTPHIVRRMIGFYNHLRNSESPIIINSLKLSVELNEEDKTSWFTSVKKIGEALSTPIDLLVNSKVLLNKRLNDLLRNHGISKKPSTSKENSNSILALRNAQDLKTT